MRWSFPIATLFGIDIKVHATFVFILLLGAIQWGVPFGLPGAVFGVIAMALLFACVVFHELGHSLSARYYGIGTREIILWPLGGLALLERQPKTAVQELVVALAGPAVNVVLAIALTILGLVTGVLQSTFAAIGEGVTAGGDAAAQAVFAPGFGTLVVWLIGANLALFLFNLIPALPMDGGRVLRAILQMSIGAERATKVSARVGQGIAFGMGAVGLFTGHLMLALIGLFVFFAAAQELGVRQSSSLLKQWRVGQAYNRHAVTLAPGDTLGRVVGLILSSYQPDFAVVHGGRLWGIITKQDVIAALSEDARDRYVTEVMQRHFDAVPESMTLDVVRTRMAETGRRVVAVMSEDGEYLGLVSAEDIDEALQVIRFQPGRPEGARA
jgi:Zn-dependent protease/CBS domain-containing protein